MILISAFGLMVGTSVAQTWNIGYPIASSVKATLKDSTLTISGTGSMRDYVNYNYFEYPWDSQKTNIKTLVIQDGVTSIGSCAFHGCKNLTSITIPESVTTIGWEAFSGCSNLSSITIPSGVTKIETSVFSGCGGLTSITIPESVTSIGKWAFENTAWYNNQPDGIVYAGNVLYKYKGTMPGNTVINNIKEGTVSIAGAAFQSCYGLTSITIPSSVTSIGYSAFENTAWYNNQPNGIVYAGNVLYKYKGTMPENTIIDVKDGTVGIADAAFRECTGLTSITFPNSVTSIESGAFYDCSSLTSISFPNSLINIGAEAFSECIGLTSITIPNSVRSIEYAFFNCDNLTAINVDANNTVYASENGVLFNKNKTMLIQYPQKKSGTSYVIPNTVTSIEYGAFHNCTALTSITIPNSVTSIENFTFYNCSALTSITIPNSVTSIGAWAFINCSSLTSITIPNSVTSIGVWAFGYCSALTSIIIPSSVTNIGTAAFSNCTALTSITVPNSVTSIGEGAFDCNCSPSEVSIPDMSSDFAPLLTSSLQKLTLTNCTSIASGSLSRFTNLTSLSLPFIGTSPTTPSNLGLLFGGDNSKVPASLKKLTLVRSSANIQIADNALAGLSGLSELTLSSNVRGLGRNALDGCSGLEHIYSEWANPPTAYNNSTFVSVNKFACVVHVPMGSKNKYAAADGWKEFYIDNIQEEAPVTITALSVPKYGGIISGALQYNYDETAKLTASGNMGYDFQGWMENNQIVSANREYTFMVEGARTLYAIFTPRENADKDIQIQAQGNSATVSWVAVEDAANYTLIIYSDDKRTQEITRFQLDANGKILRSTNLSCTISNLEQETTYYYSLTSYDAGNNALTMSNGNFKTTDGTVGMEHIVVDNQLKIYPNPTTGQLTISGVETQCIASLPQTVEIYDNTGRLVGVEYFRPDNTINISHLPNGIYFIHINGKQMKVIKQ